MTRPNIQINDEVREMTEQEYADLIASGWTLEAPASDDAGAPSTDAG